MGSGLSMASVNKIKELAAQHEYGLAVEILDSQDLEKSLNPLFLRLCGEIYENQGRFTDARRLLVKAHGMAPESNPIIFSLIDFYLRVGYRDLAKTYYELYKTSAVGQERLLQNAEYIMKKAEGAAPGELLPLLYPYYRDNMDEAWSLELFLLVNMLHRDEDADIIASDYMATFRTGMLNQTVRDIRDGKDPRTFFDIYSHDMHRDDKAEEREIRLEENKILQADHERLHPAKEEAVITELMPDDSEDRSPLEKMEETKEKTTGKKKNISGSLKKMIRRKFLKGQQEKKSAEETEQTAGKEQPDGTEQLAEQEQTSGTERAAEKIQPAEITESEKAEQSPAAGEEDDTPDFEEAAASEETSIPENQRTKQNKNTDVKNREGILLREPEKEVLSKKERLRQEMQAIQEEMSREDFVTFDMDDGFAPEADTLSGLSEVDLADETEDADLYENLQNLTAVPEPEEEIPEPAAEEPEAQEVNEEPEPGQEEIKSKPETEEEETQETEPEKETSSDTLEEEKEEISESTAEETEAEEINAESESEQEEIKSEPEPEIEEEETQETEQEEETSSDAAEEINTESESEQADVNTVSVETEPVTEADEGSVTDAGMDFPEFRTDLFPEVADQKNVENRFNDVAAEEEKKLDAGLAAEEQKMKEVEELLASLGIR